MGLEHVVRPSDGAPRKQKLGNTRRNCLTSVLKIWLYMVVATAPPTNPAATPRRMTVAIESSGAIKPEMIVSVGASVPIPRSI